MLYTNLKTTCRLAEHLAEIEQTASRMVEQTVQKMAQIEGVTEQMKATAPMCWTGLMNNFRHSAEELVLDEGGRTVKRQEILNFFQAHKNSTERTEYLKNAYTDTYVEILVDGTRVGHKKQDDGLLMWGGSYLSRTAESVFSWGVHCGNDRKSHGARRI